MKKYNYIIIVLLTICCFPKSHKSQIILEKISNHKSVKLDANRILNIYTGEIEYSGLISSIEGTSLSIITTQKVDTLIYEKLIQINFSDITRIEYCVRKNNNNCKKKNRYILPLSLGVGLIALIVTKKHETHPNLVIAYFTSGFFGSLIIDELRAPKTYIMQKKWKIVGSS